MRSQEKPAAVLPPVRDRFRALALTIVPETSQLEPEEWAELEAIVETALSKRPPGMRRQFAFFVRLLDFLPRLRWFTPFRKLHPDRRARFLRGMQSSPIFLFRRGFWGLRTLVFMGYYSRPEGYAAVGYDAHLRGWLRHPDASDAAREATLRSATHETPGTPHGPRSAGGSEAVDPGDGPEMGPDAGPGGEPGGAS